MQTVNLMKRELKLKYVAVIGIGRVGLPLALFLADTGFIVYGLGRSVKKIEEIKKGKMPFLEEGAGVLLKKHVNKRFFPTVDYSNIAKCNYIILTLGTPIDENLNPVYSQIHEAIDSAKKFLSPGQLLMLRSTVSPRTTQYVRSLIEDIRGFWVGKNFFLAFCPERITEGRSFSELRSIPQIIGGVDRRSARKAQEFFKKAGIETLLTDDITAELAKLFTNMYRYINFAVANEFMVLAQNFHKDIYEIVNLVNYKYRRGGLQLPGLTAGPCLFKDGFFLINELPFIDLISASWKINEAIPVFLVKQIRERVKLEGKKVVILGLAFKAEIDDIRASLSFKIRKALQRERAEVVIHDPYVKTYANQIIEKDVYKAIEGADVIFIATDHKIYKELNIKKVKQLVEKQCLICDVWNVFGTGRIIYRLNYINGE